MGSGGIAFSEGSPSLQQDKLHSGKNATKQAFPKEPGFQLLGTGYINTDKPSLAPLLEYQGTDYKHDRQVFPWDQFQSKP